MHREDIKKIQSNVYELSNFFSFFKKGKLKADIFSSLKDVEKSLEELPSLKNELIDSTKKHTTLESAFESHKKNSEESLQNKDEKINNISTKLDNIQSKYFLVSKLLSLKSTNQGLEDYKRVLYGDFMTFANIEESLANEAEAILKLQAIEKELEVITAYPQLHKKNTIAIGGGFSAGKSEFISSFFKSAIKLPIGITPTTAIPTYVMNAMSDQVLACNHNGGIIDLKKIDANFHSKISHDSIKSFDFNLKEIMPLMIVSTQFDYEHICFIDTPGYNPAQSDDNYAQDDVHTAKEFLNNASAFIWLIGADANGTIPSSDLNFLNELELENKNLYVVYNKADLKSQSDIENVLEEIEKSLDDYSIKYIGISAFSSLTKQEYAYKKQSLINFINDRNYESQVHKVMLEKLYDVYLMYKRAILTDIKEKEAIKSQIKSISLDMLEEGFDDMSNTAFQRLNKLEKVFSTKKQETNLKTLEDVTEKLKNTIDAVFENEFSIDFEDIKKHEIEIDFDFSINLIEEDETNNV